jgi:hypothetical protein
MCVPLVLDNLLVNVRALAAYRNTCRACTSIAMHSYSVLFGLGKLAWPSELQSTGSEPIRRALVKDTMYQARWERDCVNRSYGWVDMLIKELVTLERERALCFQGHTDILYRL